MFSKGYKINDRYEIIKSIGEGGMANVYLAVDTILDRKVAVKVLRGDLSSDDKFIRRFEREAWSVSNLSHENIVEVYDVGEDNKEHYIVMEYIEGKTLKQLLKKRETLTVSEVIDIMRQITAGISHAHSAYIIHRDIKPQNIMILDSGLIKITDFGIAMALNATQLTQTNSVMGSVHYIPPEQANGKTSTVKSDIYSMGILMYELLIGKLPFNGDNAVEIALKHMKEKIPSVRKQNPTIPQSVENIIIKATAKNPRNRYDTAKEMEEDLITALDKENEKKITFEYPEKDFDNDDVVDNTKSKKEKIEKPIKKEYDIIEDDEEEIDNGDLTTNRNKKKKKPIIIGTLILILVILLSSGYILLSSYKVKEVKVPDVVDMDIDDAIYKIEEAGFKYKVVEKEDENVEEGKVIKTSPKAKSKRKKGTTVILYESTGGDYINIEDYTGEAYEEIKAKLELHNVSVTIEKKEVDNPEDYKDKANIIIDQSIKYDEENEQKIGEGDSIVLYIPNVVDTYPDMLSEGWTLSDVISFSKEYDIEITVMDFNSITIPESDYDDYMNSKIVYQSRPAGDNIVSGISCKVKIEDTYEKEVLDDLMP